MGINPEDELKSGHNPDTVLALVVQEVRSGFGQINGRLDKMNGTVAELGAWRVQVDQLHAVQAAVTAALGGRADKTDKAEQTKLEALKETLKAWGPVIASVAAIGAAAAVAIPQLVK